MDPNIPAPKVFISYAWTDEPHKEWVLRLATRLCDHGVGVRLDRWHLREGHDKNAFMEEITDDGTTKVLVICDRLYQEKANGRMGGVGTESIIISQKVYAEVKNEKFIPIIVEKDEDGNAFVPTFMNGRMYIDLSHDEGTNDFEEAYKQLLRVIFDRPQLIQLECSPKPDPGVMRVVETDLVMETLDEETEASHAGADHSEAS